MDCHVYRVFAGKRKKIYCVVPTPSTASRQSNLDAIHLSCWGAEMDRLSSGLPLFLEGRGCVRVGKCWVIHISPSSLFRLYNLGSWEQEGTPIAVKVNRCSFLSSYSSAWPTVFFFHLEACLADGLQTLLRLCSCASRLPSSNSPIFILFVQRNKQT